MAPEKVTVMVLKVDLQCSKCYRKVKKLMCKFPQIRDQVFDEKSNSVTITVVCCSPERIRDKLCSKGGGSIKSIDIKEPPKPKPPAAAGGGGDAPPPQAKAKEPEKPKDQPPPSKPKDAEKPKAAEKPKDAEKPKAAEKPKEGEKPKPPAEKPKDDPKPQPPQQPPQQPPAKSAQPLMAPVQAYPSPIQMYPNGVGYGHGHGVCYEGCGMGPCNHVSYGQPLLAVPCYESYGRPVYDSWGGGSVAGGGVYGRNAYHVGRNDGNYFSDENQQGCIIM